MRTIFNKMSFFRKNLLLSSINIILIGTILIASSYIIQKEILIKQLHKQIQVVTDSWVKGIDEGEAKKAVQEKNYDGPVQTKFRDYLTKISQNNPNIAQAYLFGTELQDGNKTSLVAMPTSLMTDFKKNNLFIGDMYEQPQEVVHAIESMLKSNEPTFTSSYSDMFGTWATITYPIHDESGKIFAYFAVDADASMVPEGLHALLVNSIIILAVFLIIILLIQYFAVRKTLSPIKDLVRGIEHVSEGNFDIEIKTGQDDLGIINDKFNDMVRKIREMLAKVQETSQEVTESARALLSISEDNNSKSILLTNNIQEVSSGIKSQEQATIDSARAMSDMATVIQTIASSAANVSDEAYAMEQKSIEGNEIVQQVATQMGLITQSVSSTSNAIRKLENRSREIGDILGIITGISSQTNLLALNAAIEAARVGEHGKGFAVVAGEVRKLAEQSERSANQISELITEIQTEILNAVESMKQGKGDVEKGIAVAEQSGILFEEILNATKKVADQIQEVSSATEEISAGTEEITATSEELTITAQKTAATSDKITKTIQEQQTSMKGVVDASTKMTTLSEELQELVKQFNVK